MSANRTVRRDVTVTNSWTQILSEDPLRDWVRIQPDGAARIAFQEEEPTGNNDGTRLQSHAIIREDPPSSSALWVRAQNSTVTIDVTVATVKQEPFSG